MSEGNKVRLFPPKVPFHFPPFVVVAEPFPGCSEIRYIAKKVYRPDREHRALVCLEIVGSHWIEPFVDETVSALVSLAEGRAVDVDPEMIYTISLMEHMMDPGGGMNITLGSLDPAIRSLDEKRSKILCNRITDGMTRNGRSGAPLPFDRALWRSLRAGYHDVIAFALTTRSKEAFALCDNREDILYLSSVASGMSLEAALIDGDVAFMTESDPPVYTPGPDGVGLHEPRDMRVVDWCGTTFFAVDSDLLKSLGDFMRADMRFEGERSSMTHVRPYGINACPSRFLQLMNWHAGWMECNGDAEVVRDVYVLADYLLADGVKHKIETSLRAYSGDRVARLTNLCLSDPNPVVSKLIGPLSRRLFDLQDPGFIRGALEGDQSTACARMILTESIMSCHPSEVTTFVCAIMGFLCERGASGPFDDSLDALMSFEGEGWGALHRMDRWEILRHRLRAFLTEAFMVRAVRLVHSIG